VARIDPNMNVATDPVPTRESLLIRLKDWGDQESWRVFFDTYWKIIYTAAIRAGLTDAEAQDVVQETVISVLKTMPQFEYDPRKGSFKGWLLHLTTWRVGDQLRRRQRGIEDKNVTTDGDDTSTQDMKAEEAAMVANSEFETAWEEEWEQNLWEAAIERVKKKVDPKHYQAFDLYVVKKWPVLKVARALKVSASSVYLNKHRISNSIKKEILHLRTNPI